MMNDEQLYTEVKPDISALASALFDFSELCLKERGNFLPHGAVLTEDGEVKLVGAVPESGNDITNSTDVLPVLHEGLRFQAKNQSLKAVAVAENVTITLEDQNSTRAIKVLFEHKRGLTVALYLPFDKRLFKGYTFGNVFSLAADPEVNAWVGA